MRTMLPEAAVVVDGAQEIANLLDVILVHPTLHTSTLLTLSRRIRLALEAREVTDTA